MKRQEQQVGKDPASEKEKPQRDIRSFEAEQDVGRMLDRANDRGVKTVFLCNKALRKLLTDMGYARKKDLQAQSNG